MRGIIAYEKPRGKKRFFLRWRDDTGRKVAKAFPTAAAREKFARSLMRAREKIGNQAMCFDPDEWVTWLRVKEIIGPVDPITVALEWYAYRRGEAGGGMAVADALERYFSACGPTDEPRILYRKKLNLGRFAAVAGGLPLRDVTAERVRDWLAPARQARWFRAGHNQASPENPLRFFLLVCSRAAL